MNISDSFDFLDYQPHGGDDEVFSSVVGVAPNFGLGPGNFPDGPSIMDTSPEFPSFGVAPFSKGEPDRVPDFGEGVELKEIPSIFLPPLDSP